MKYRSRVEIIAEILRSAEEGASKSTLNYAAYLSHAQLMGYLEPLLEKRLLSFDKNTQHYWLTLRGQEFLEAFDQINDVLLAFHPTAEEEEISPAIQRQRRTRSN